MGISDATLVLRHPPPAPQSSGVACGMQGHVCFGTKVAFRSLVQPLLGTPSQTQTNRSSSYDGHLLWFALLPPRRTFFGLA